MRDKRLLGVLQPEDIVEDIHDKTGYDYEEISLIANFKKEQFEGRLAESSALHLVGIDLGIDRIFKQAKIKEKKNEDTEAFKVNQRDFLWENLLMVQDFDDYMSLQISEERWEEQDHSKILRKIYQSLGIEITDSVNRTEKQEINQEALLKGEQQ